MVVVKAEQLSFPLLLGKTYLLQLLLLALPLPLSALLSLAWPAPAFKFRIITVEMIVDSDISEG